ncbi:MAG TPA: alpha/beta fold hydrolase [Verrucomicrobiae bacterium]|nr:alpha/beta fold hydrolase [Verrucomicrobiae bacterium]
MKSVLILGGWKANAQAGWMPWLIQWLGQRAIPHHFCQLPYTWAPSTVLGVRLALQKAKELPGPKVIVCHSFGGKVALKALSENDLPIDGLIMVAPLYRWPLSKWFPFWKDYVNFEQLKKNCPRIIVIHSKDDNLVPFLNSLELVRKCKEYGIEVEFCVHQTSGHFDPKSHCFELPEVVEAYEKICASS